MTWKITPATSGSDVYLTDEDGKYVAHVSAAGNKTLALLAATPDMLEALKMVFGDIESGFIAQDSRAGERCLDRHEKAIRAAIVKAEGKI